MMPPTAPPRKLPAYGFRLLSAAGRGLLLMASCLVLLFAALICCSVMSAFF